MSVSDPQFFYMVLVLPGLFGLTLLGEGISKIFHQENGAWMSVIFGVVFILVVAFSFLLFAFRL